MTETKACPQDQSAPVAPWSTLADLAFKAGISADDIKAYLAWRGKKVSPREYNQT